MMTFSPGSILRGTAIALAASAAAYGQTTQTTTFEKVVLPFLAKNCLGCHSAKAKSGDVNLEAFRTRESMLKDPHTWDRVFEKLSTGQMPPPPMPKPPAAEVRAVTGWIQREFEKVERATPPDPGRVTARRLNRAEYNNTIRDLLGIDLRPADDFPQDDSGYGFDNIGDVLSLSPVLMERYLAAADTVVRLALFGRQAIPPAAVRYQPYRYRPFDEENSFIKQGLYTLHEYDESGVSMPNAFHFRHRFPIDGEYVIRATPEGVRPTGSDPIKLGFWVDGKLMAERIVEKNDLEGQMREYRHKFTAGDHWIAVSFLRQFEGLPSAYKGPKPSSQQPPQNRFALPPLPPPPANATPKELEEYKQRQAEREKRAQAFANRPRPLQPADGIRINLADVVGPFEPVLGPSPAAAAKIFVCGHLDGKHAAGCERRIISDLARRAYRRLVTREDLNPLMALAAKARSRGDSFEEAIGLALRAILVSPNFLFRIERVPPQTEGAYAISQHELASRISYFLWSSMPDDELLQAADRQTLRTPAVLEAQVRRMLRDPKAKAISENFLGQWLQTRAMESHKPDPAGFPFFEEYLGMSMVRETELLFEHILREDRSILDFLDAKYTFLNERLAHFYGIRGVKGPEFRRVELSDVPRRGIVTHASVLTVSSYPNRTSPVLRGKWVLENILNTPPPPPPPNVPTLDTSKVGESASLKQQLQEHRANAVCASCHSRMDPLGFGLENYTAIGSWREKDGKVPVDATGKLPNGHTFNGPEELISILRGDGSAFTSALAAKMLTYALGRGLERSDRRAVKGIADSVAASQHHFSSLVLGVIKSLPFQKQRGVPAK